MIDFAHVKAHRSTAGGKGGEQTQAVDRSRGRRNTKINALADAKGRLIAILLTGVEATNAERISSSLRLVSDLKWRVLRHGAAFSTENRGKSAA